MLQIESKKTIESTTTPGVTFTVRRLNRVQRAKRDFPLMASIVRYSEAIGRYNELAKIENRTPEQAREIGALRYEINTMSDREFKPASIAAGLVSITGLEIDGKTATAETLLRDSTDACDDLVEEIHEACEAASGLSAEQSKNYESPSTLPVPKDGEIAGTTAETAG